MDSLPQKGEAHVTKNINKALLSVCSPTIVTTETSSFESGLSIQQWKTGAARNKTKEETAKSQQCVLQAQMLLLTVSVEMYILVQNIL